MAATDPERIAARSGLFPIADMDRQWHPTTMGDRLKIIESPDGRERVIIFRRPDGNFTYRMQWADPLATTEPDFGWGSLGPDCGIYNSPETALLEAMMRVSWLKGSFH